MVQEVRMNVGKTKKFNSVLIKSNLDDFIFQGIINEWETILNKPILSKDDLLNLEPEERTKIFNSYKKWEKNSGLRPKRMFDILFKERYTILQETNIHDQLSVEKVMLQRKFLMKVFKPVKNRSQFIREMKNNPEFFNFTFSRYD